MGRFHNMCWVAGVSLLGACYPIDSPVDPEAPSASVQSRPLSVVDDTPRPEMPEALLMEYLEKTGGRVVIGLKEAGAVRGVSSDGRARIPDDLAVQAATSLAQTIDGLTIVRGATRRRVRFARDRGVWESTVVSPRIVARLEQDVDVVRALRSHPNVDYVAPDMPGMLLGETKSWGVDSLRAPSVWGSYDGSGVNVAIIDSGLDYNPTLGSWKAHPDLGNFVFSNETLDTDDILNGACSSYSTACYFEEAYHGTGLWGALGAKTYSDTLTTGVAPGISSLYAYKIVFTTGAGSPLVTVSNMIEGFESLKADLDASIDIPVAVTSAAFDTACAVYCYQGIHDAIIEVEALNTTLIFAAAGNTSPSYVLIPAVYDEVVAVGALNQDLSKPTGHATGPQLEFTAPGMNVYISTNRLNDVDGEGAQYSGGSSFAAPAAAGVAALLADKYPSWTASQLRARMQTYARDLGSAGRDNTFGYGFPDAVCILNGTSC